MRCAAVDEHGATTCVWVTPTGPRARSTPLKACEVPYPFVDGLSSELMSDKAKQRIAREGFVDNIDREPWLLWCWDVLHVGARR